MRAILRTGIGSTTSSTTGGGDGSDDICFTGIEDSLVVKIEFPFGINGNDVTGYLDEALYLAAYIKSNDDKELLWTSEEIDGFEYEGIVCLLQPLTQKHSYLKTVDVDETYITDNLPLCEDENLAIYFTIIYFDSDGNDQDYYSLEPAFWSCLGPPEYYECICSTTGDNPWENFSEYDNDLSNNEDGGKSDENGDKSDENGRADGRSFKSPKGLQISPNPFKHFLNFSEKNTKVPVIVTDVNGKEIYKCESNSGVVNTSQWTDGLYIVSFFDGLKWSSEKYIKY